jgi:hypothetical protein
MGWRSLRRKTKKKKKGDLISYQHPIMENTVSEENSY